MTARRYCLSSLFARFEPYVGVGAQEMGIKQKLGHTEKGKLASEEFAHPWLRDIKHPLQLSRCYLLPLDELENVLMQISF